MATDPLSPFAQGVVNDALQATFPQRQNPDPFNESVLKVLNDRANESTSGFNPDSTFSKQFFGVDSPDQILRAVGPARDDPNTMIYEFAGDGQRYNAPVDKTPEEVLEAIWDKKSPGIWGAAKGATFYSMPSELSSALAYSLEGVGLENLGQQWHEYADNLKAEYQKNYGQYTVPDVQAAWDQGKLYDYALQTIGAGAPYMALGIAGGLGGGAMAAARGASARLGTFLGAAGVTAPITIAQFADRQVQALKEQGVENPRDHIDWVKAATLGTVAAGLQAIPVDSILFAGPILSTLEKWGVDLGSRMSTRLLGNMADVAGTNAFVAMGTAGLSRMNADMPLLDDEAKAEYLNAAVMGTLVGVPFGLYKGYRYQPKAKVQTDVPDSSFPGDVVPERPVSETVSTMKEDIIYGTDQTTPQAAIPPPLSGIIRDPNADYGITDRVQAAEFLQSIKYTDKNGNVRDGLTDFWQYFNDPDKGLGRDPTDKELIEAARKASFVRARESYLKRTPDGVMYKDIDDQPQVHSNDDKILTKAAALTDQFGYNDAVVRNFSDAMINKLYRMNIQRDLEQTGAKYPDEIRKKVMEDFENFVDKKVMEDVQQYGSIYKRPEAQERINSNIKRANQMLSENPRKRIAEALMNKRRSEAEAKQEQAAQGEYDPTPVITPTYKSKFIEEPPVDGEAFGPYAGLKTEPLGVRGLLEYKPTQVAEVLTNAANMPGNKATPKLKKSEVVDALLKSPLFQRLLNENHYSTAQIRAIAENYWKERLKNKTKFKTAKGSVYTIDPINGRTKRNKAYRPEHGEKEQGEQPLSAATIYLDDEAVKRMGVPTGSPWEIVVDEPNGVAHVLTWNAAEKRWGYVPSGKSIPFSKEPSLGATPVEFWNKGKHGFSKVHFGNKIIEIMKAGDEDADVPFDSSPKPGEFRYEPKNFKGKPKAGKVQELKDVGQQTLDQLRDEVYKLATERNTDFLKKNPDLGPTLNEMFKRFSELSANVKVSEKPRIMKATKKFSEQVMNRVKLSNAIQNVFNKIHPNLSKLFSQSFDKMLNGAEMDKATFNAMLTSLHTAFNVNKPEKLNAEALATWYKNMRQFLPDRTIEALNKNRQFFVEWYGTQEGVNPKDLGNFRTEDLEAMAFAQHMKGNLTANIAKFKDLKQKKIFSAFEKSFRQLNKEFADIGYKKLEDILEYNDSPDLFETNSKEVPPEARRPGVFADRVLDDINKPDEQTAKAKVEEIKEAGVEANMSTPPPNFKGPQTKSGRDSNDPFLSSEDNNIGDAAGFFSFVFSIPKMSRKYPIFGRVHNIFVKQKDIAANVDMAFTKQFDYVYKDLANRDMDKVKRAAEILDHMRNTKQDINTDSAGRVVFKDENGNDVVMTKPDSEIVKGVQEFFKIGFKENLTVVRNHLDHFMKEYGINRTSSLDQIRNAIDNVDTLIKDNPLPEFRNKYVRDRDNLQSLHNHIKNMENILQKNIAYVPHMRFGDYVVWVKDRKTGNLVHMEVLDNTDNLLGLKTRKLPSKKHADQKIDQLGIRKKFDPRDYEISHGQLTYNNAATMIQRGMLSMELIQSLNATGLERNIRLAHELATKVSDPVAFMKEWAEEAGSTKNHLMRYILAQGMGKHAIRAQDEPVITGYNRNWDLVMDNYKNTAKNSIARQAISLELAQVQKDILLDGKIAPNLKEQVTNYINYMQDPSTDFGALRNFNFFWTMGYRFSTAALQLATLPTQAAGVLVGYSGNPLQAMAYLSKGIKTLTTPRNKEFFEKHPAYFRQSMTEDAIAKEVQTDAISHWGPVAKKAEKGFNFIKNNAGFFVSRAENFTRKSSFLAFRNMFEASKENTRKAIKDLENDYDWQYFWNNNKNSDMKVEEALALYHMRLIHAEFGKTGRGPMQRGLFGSLAFPFMTYPQQMLELLFEQMVGRKGAAGVLAGLYTMGAYVALSGLNGIPAYDLWKTLYETYEEKVNGRKIDLNMQLDAAGVPEFLRRGALSMMTNADMSSRLAQDMIGQNLIIGLLKDDIKIGEITGVPGRTLVEMMNGVADVFSSSSTKSPLEKALPFLPSVGKDVIKATQINTEPENYWKTKSGKILVDPEERSDYRTFTDTTYQALGFTPLDKTRERERLFMQQRANQEFTGWKSRLAERAATAEYLMYLGSTQDDNEKYEEGRQMRADVTKDLREYAKKNDIRLDTNFWRGFRTSVKERLWQKKNPGEIKKPTKQERKYEDVLKKE